MKIANTLLRTKMTTMVPKCGSSTTPKQFLSMQQSSANAVTIDNRAHFVSSV
jgi:hypothetical protein